MHRVRARCGRSSQVRAVAVAAVMIEVVSGPFTATASSADVTATVHLEIDGGQHAGTYDLASDRACLVYGDGAWEIRVDDPDQLPSYVSMLAGGPGEFLTISWYEGGGYSASELDLDVDEADGIATLSVTAVGIDTSAPADAPPAAIRITVTCHVIDDLRTAAPTTIPTDGPAPASLPMPEEQAPPPPGATVITLDVGFGPWMGSYESWTTDDACFIADGAWLVTFHDPTTLPSSVSVVAAESDDDEPAFGLLTAEFGPLTDSVRYELGSGPSFDLDPAGTATIVDAAAVATAHDGSESSGPLTATIVCSVVSS